MYRKHADELMRFATGLVGPSDANDVFQEGFVRALNSKAWPSIKNRRAFLYRCVLSEAQSFLRTSARRRRREERTWPGDTKVEENLHPEVRAVIEGLSVRQRAVILLTYWSDLDPSSIGDLLGISEGAVRRHLARARAHLKERLDDDN